MDQPGGLRWTARLLVALGVVGVLASVSDVASAQPAEPTQSFSVARGIKAPGGYEVLVLAGSRNPAPRVDGPFVCAVAMRTVTRGMQRVSDMENGCVFDPWQGTARYTFLPGLWTSTASGTFRTLVTTSTEDYVDGRWQQTSHSMRWSRATADLEWRGTDEQVVRQWPVGARVDRQAAVSGRIAFHGLGLTVTPSNAPGVVWFETR